MKVYIGIDWSEAKHDVLLLNEAGAAIAQMTIPHGLEGFEQLEHTRQRLGLDLNSCIVGLETAHNLIIDFLWSRGYSRIYVVPPTTIKGNRSRFRHSRARSDASDAMVIADCLRTDQGRLQPWKPDQPLTRHIRAKVSLINCLTKEIVRLSNRLRSVLLRYYPAALNVFSSWPTQIGLSLIQSYPTPQEAQALTPTQFCAFTREHHYPQGRVAACFARLQADYPEASASTVASFQDEAILLASFLQRTLKAKSRSLRDLGRLFSEHPDAPIFASLPGAGDLLAPALLGKFGDDRERFPSPASVQALAGTCPVTDSSGKRRIIRFRRACDREFRYIAQQWARASLERSVWANAYFQTVYGRCQSINQAYRCLANRWLAILWKLWQSHELYDEAYHLNQRAKHSKR
ncbi:MAG: transposase [Anaerolineales bacterium]|jgi:transposase